MQSFHFIGEEDLDTGLYINSHVDYTKNITLYNLPAVVPDVVTTTSTSQYFESAIPSPTQLPPNSWTTQGIDLSTTVSGASVTLSNVLAYRIDIVADNQPTGAFVKVYANGQNLENFSTYGPLGTQTIYEIPLNGTRPNTISLYNTGFSSKAAPYFTGPTNTSGTSVGGSIALQLNNTTIITDTWTFTALSSTTYNITRTSTGGTNTYNINVSQNNAIPGFNVSVNSAGLSVGDSAVVKTNAVGVLLNSYTIYPNLTTLGQWVSPIMDSGNPFTQWTEAKWEAPINSTSAYLSQVKVGSTATPDQTWQIYVPQTVTFIDYPNQNNQQAFRTNVASCGMLTGQYAQAIMSLTGYTDYVRSPEFFFWRPASDSFLTLLGPIVGGPTVQAVMSAWAALSYKWYQKYHKYIKGKAISSSEQEQLLQWGFILGVPMHVHENFTDYQQRLMLIKQGAYSGANLNFIQSALQAYCLVNGASQNVYVKPLQSVTQQWALGSGEIGINTYLGGVNTKAWSYEIHIPGADPGVVPDDLLKFIYFINPVGAIPILIFE